MTPADEQRLRTLLREAAEIGVESSMKPFLPDRIMRQIQSRHHPYEEFFQSLMWGFRPVILASTLLILGFISYSTVLSRSYEVLPTPTEIVFGLQPFTLSTTYASDLNEFLPAIP